MSAKIQQLLNTLKRPKRRPLPEFYEDNDIELEIAANPKDPNAPKPEVSVDGWMIHDIITDKMY